MSPKYWEASGDLSSDSSAESSQDETRDVSPDVEEVSLELRGDVKFEQVMDSMDSKSDMSSEGARGPPNTNAGALSRVMATNFPMPNLQPHQHASLFYLSLIEGRCRTQAATSLNAGRRAEDHLAEDHPEVCDLAEHLFTEMSKELVKAGMIPEEFVGRPLPELRLYLTSFDAILNTIATKRPQDLSENNSYQALNSGSYFSFHRDASTSSFNPSQALIRRAELPFPMPPSAQQPAQSHLLTLLSPRTQGNSVPMSIYAKEYKQLSALGKGGFGHVYKVRHYLDKAEYAIKKIVIQADHLQFLKGKDRLGNLFAEVQTLSKLNHRNVVRYYHCWLETRPAGSGSESTDQESGQTLSVNTNMGSRLDALTSGFNSIQLGIEREFKNEMRKVRRNSTTHEASPDMILFEEDSKSAGGKGKGKSSVKSKTVAEKPEKLRFFKASNEPDDSDDEDDEEDHHETGSGSTVEFPLIKTDGQEPNINFDLVLYIKMMPYPLSLQDYIFPENDKLALNLRHCFHILPTIRLLLRILEGVEYLHRKNIVHRDLKPGNIFLEFLDASEPATDGFIDIKNCKECNHDDTTTSTHIRPCIGDFGLIADLKAPKPDTPNSSVVESDSDRYPFSMGTSHHAVGTKLYVPPQVPKVEPIICPKLDVYSLGVIAFELTNNFMTGSERGWAFKDLREAGIFPKKFEGHPMAEGIKGMLCVKREERWDCPMIREWLLDLEKKFE